MPLELYILFFLLGLCAIGATIGGILEIHYQTTTSGTLRVTNSLGQNVTGSPFSGVKVDTNIGNGQGMFAGGLLALLSGVFMLIVLIIAFFNRGKLNECQPILGTVVSTQNS